MAAVLLRMSEHKKSEPLPPPTPQPSAPNQIHKKHVSIGKKKASVAKAMLVRTNMKHPKNWPPEKVFKQRKTRNHRKNAKGKKRHKRKEGQITHP